MIERCVSYASFIDTIALLVSHERFFHLLLESFALMKLSPREVDRYLYSEFNRLKKSAIGFRPLAGRIDCSTRNMAFTDTHVLGAFPAPREVNRLFYLRGRLDSTGDWTVSGPSRGG